MHNANAIRIFNSIADGGDGTLDVMGYDLPRHGYFVAGVGTPLIFDTAEEANRPASLKLIAEFVRVTSARFVGWWKDSETGKVYVDGTDWFWDPAQARKTASDRSEIAYWDIGSDSEIRTQEV